MTNNFTIRLALRSWGILILSLVLSSCTVLDIERLGKIRSQPDKKKAQKPPTREVVIPLEKAQPSKLPEALTQIQPALDLKIPEPKATVLKVKL